MINDVFKSFFRTIGRILAYIAVGLVIAYFAGFVKPANVKAAIIENDNFSLNTLTYNGYTLRYDSNLWFTGGNTYTMTIGLVPYGWIAGTNLYVSVVLCGGHEWSFTSTSATGVSNASVSSSNYACSFANSTVKGQVIMYTFNLSTGSGNEFLGNFYIYQYYTSDFRLIDFVVSDTAFAKFSDYSAEDNALKQQQIIDKQTETNSKIDDVKSKQDTTNSKLDEAETTRKGILSSIKDVLTSIANLPKKIIDLMITALKSLFIPDDTEFITNFVESIESKLGFIAEVPVSVINFGLGLVNASWTEVTSVSFPSISIFGYYFWDAQNIDISTGINIFKPYKYITDILCVCICVGTLNKWREKFTGGGN